MFSVVLLVAVTAGGESVEFGRRGGCGGGCYGASAGRGRLFGGGGGGFCGKKRRGGGCYGGCGGVVYGGGGYGGCGGVVYGAPSYSGGGMAYGAPSYSGGCGGMAYGAPSYSGGCGGGMAYGAPSYSGGCGGVVYGAPIYGGHGSMVPSGGCGTTIIIGNGGSGNGKPDDADAKGSALTADETKQLAEMMASEKDAAKRAEMEKAYKAGSHADRKKYYDDFDK